ncbi:DUF6093 family protein [Nonomuraea sediminis]|uniref:DUF6093 family protein n=1 Tax=Nonomuraea sediminis TaxID=2835864 RepID=UPI001BDBED6A|nr:DUF6093 family protein [Nonomuraea sediminis]
MSIQDALASPRELIVDAVMDETCRVEHRTGTVLDPDTTAEVDVWETVYEGPCKAKPLTGGHDTQWGEAEVVLHRYTVKLPYSAATPIEATPGYRAIVTASADSWLIGRPLEVVDVVYSATAVTRRLIVEDRSGGSGG